MRFLVTPEFTEKLSSLPHDGKEAVTKIVAFVESSARDALERGGLGVQLRMLGNEIFLLRSGRYAAYGTFGNDKQGEYFLFLDISAESPSATASRSEFFATRDPRKSLNLDPNRNMMIDPRRNMMIDPSRNMMIDPNRNMMIDPRRNMMIDPNRNMMIDPRRNRFYGGPYLYDCSLTQEGFVVGANDKVSLVFNPSAQFTHFIVSNESRVENMFDTNGRWVEFLVPTENGVRLRFDTNRRWKGLIV